MPVHALPHLTSLHLANARPLGTRNLLDIASHSTLHDIRLDNCSFELCDFHWLGVDPSIPLDTQQLKQHAETPVVGNVEEEEGVEAEGAMIDGVNDPWSQNWTMHKLQRLDAALKRTQPTRRSCELRLALADWLPRCLQCGNLRQATQHRPDMLMYEYCKQVASLRRTLQQQLSDFAANK